MTHDAHRWLLRYVEQVVQTSVVHRATAKAAVALTRAQHDGLGEYLSRYWSRPYPCPERVDLKPQHGYRSRVEKDGYRPEEFVE